MSLGANSEGMVQSLKELKRGHKNSTRDPKAEVMAAEIEQLRLTLCDQTIELTLLKKSVSSGYKQSTI